MHHKQANPLAGLDRSIELPEIALLLDVAQAIARMDDAELERLSKQSPRPERVYEHARTSSPFTAHTITGTRNVEHSALWLMPVVSKAGAAVATGKAPTEQGSQGPHIGRWIQDWFGMRDASRSYDYLASYGCIATMSAGQVRCVLEGLVRRKVAAAEFPAPQHEEIRAQHRAGLPDLAYFLGTASCIGDYPTIPAAGRPQDAPLIQRVSSALALWAGEPRGAGDSYRVAMPAPFSEALCAGLQMWVQEVAKDFDTLAWDAIPHGAGNVALEWDVLNRATGVQAKMYRRLQTAQLGEKSIQAVLAAVQKTTEKFDGPQAHRKLS